MNAKKCKELRRTARFTSNPGESLRQLVGFAQLTNGQHDKPGMPKYQPISAVNNPQTFRGRYRNLKSGRVIDPRRMEMASRVMHAQAAEKLFKHTTTASGIESLPIPKPTIKEKLVGAFRRFRKQH